MKKYVFLCIMCGFVVLSGCDTEHNFMDVDNPNAKEDLKHYIGSGNIPKINSDDLIPDNLSGVREDTKGYANQYYEDNLKEYVNTAKEGLSGKVQELKGYYNSGIDHLNGEIANKVNDTISGELNKFKIK